MNIYSSSDSLILAVTVDDNSYRNRQIMGDHNLTLYYSLAEHTEIPVGSYVEYQGVKYTLERPEAFKMKHRRLFEYTVTFEAYQSRAKRWKFRNTVDGRLKFPLTATPREHLQMFVDNMNRRDSGWTIGACVTGVEHLINYDNNYCIEALQAMADEFGTEFEISGKTVSLHKVEYNKSNPLPLSYGRGNGFKPNVGRSNSGDAMPVEILFAVGGEENIDPHAYGNRSLLLPEGGAIGFDGVHFSDEEGFDATNARYYSVSEDRLSIQRNDKELSSQAEDSLDCSDIYPKRVGTVGQVIIVDADNHFYDFTDTNPASDPCPDFEECLIAGETMTVRFQSGMLAGREFEVKYNHNPKTEKGVQKLGRRFEIVPQEIDGVTMPDATFKPVAGDTYAVFHCSMPTGYTAKAEADMFRAAVRYMYEHEDQRFSFTGELDGIWAKKDWVNIGGRIVLGGYIRFTDESFQTDPVLVRITGIKDYINNPHSPEITLSNETITGGFNSEFKRVQAEEVTVDENLRRGEQFTKRRFRDAQETMKMIEQALIEGYTKSISPIAAQMLQLLVGDESLQYRLVTSNTAANPTVVTPVFAFDSDTGVFTVTGGYYLQHLTIGVQMKASHAVSEYKWWTVQAYTSAVLDDPDKRYYLYLKCPIEGGVDCQYILSQTAIKMTAAAGYYHFLVGVLNSEYEGERSFTSLYGFTEITGGRITTDKIVSSDGNTYFDLAGSEIGGRIVFTNRSGQVITLPELENALHQEVEDAKNAADKKVSDAIKSLETAIETGDTATYEAALEDIQAFGRTIISGGYIKTDLINVDDLVAKNVYSKDGKFQILSDGTMKAVNGVFEGYLQTKFTEVGSDSFTISSILNISTPGGFYNQVITLPHDASFIGKRVCIVNTNYPPYTKTSIGFYTTIQIDSVLKEHYIGIGGNIDVDASSINDPAVIQSFDLRGGVVELVAVPVSWGNESYCRWILLTGKHSIMRYQTL